MVKVNRVSNTTVSKTTVVFSPLETGVWISKGHNTVKVDEDGCRRNQINHKKCNRFGQILHASKPF